MSSNSRGTFRFALSFAIAPALVVSFAAATGCSAEGMDAPGYETPSTDRQALALQKLEELGFDTTNAQFLEEDDEVVVEDDILFSVPMLVDSDPGFGTEGYRSGMVAGNGNSFTFHLEFDSDVVTGWKNEFKSAAQKYANASSKITYSTSGAGYAIRIKASAFTTGSPMFPVPNTWTYARAGFPVMGMPYPKIDINTNYDSAGCTPSGSIPPQKVRRTVAMHELGHTLGFRHPQDYDDRVHISGTASCSFDYSKFPPVDMCDLANNPNVYHTVMHSHMTCNANSSRVYWGLTADDVDSVQEVW